MPRQTFLTRETFLESTESKIRELLLSLPAYCANIAFKSENFITGILLFEYTPGGKKQPYLISASVLPLNEQYTRVHLHASQADHAAFYENPDMMLVLHKVEASIQALVCGDFSYFNSADQKQEVNKNNFWTAVQSLISPLVLKKKFT